MSSQGQSVKRVLGTFDLTMLLVVAVVNLNLVPAVAGAGVNVLPLWALAFFLFFLPQAVAVIALSSRYEGEGGVYVWSKVAFGDFHGFVSGWCYWTNNIFYLPTLLFYVVGFCLYVRVDRGGALADSAAFMTLASSLLLLWASVALSIRGVGLSKWLQNCGAVATFVIVVVVAALAALALSRAGGVGAADLNAVVPAHSEWRTYSALGLVCFAFVGLELGSVMGGEIREPHRSVPRAVVIAGLCCVTLYMICSFALQSAIPPGEIEAVSGLLQAAERLALEAGLGSLVRPLALVLGLSVAGAFCAWLAGSARIPFVIGLDRHLPSSFGRTHARYGTPHVALAVQGVVISLVLLLASAGSGVRDVYLLLLNTAVVIQLIPFLYTFAALLKMTRRRSDFRSERGFFKASWPGYLAGTLGVVTTAAGICLAFVPPEGSGSALLYEVKIWLACVCFVAPAALLFRRSAGARAHAPSAYGRPAPREDFAATDSV